MEYNIIDFGTNCDFVKFLKFFFNQGLFNAVNLSSVKKDITAKLLPVHFMY